MCKGHEKLAHRKDRENDLKHNKTCTTLLTVRQVQIKL